ncbi:MAG: protein kinase [Zoogloeaceae bacterium]|nr:protein kinase [Zoogloeaceae bacterium]
MNKRYIRVCPVCDTENPPEQVYCGTCAALISGVDFSLAQETAEAAPQAAGSEAPAAPSPETLARKTLAAAPEPAPEPTPAPEAPAPVTTPPEPAPSAPVSQEPAPPSAEPAVSLPPAPAVELATPALTEPAITSSPAEPAPTASTRVNAPDLSIPADDAYYTVLCPDPDCGQANPLGSVRCRYCNTLLPETSPTLLRAASSRMRPMTENAPALELEPVALDSLPNKTSFRKRDAPRRNLPDDLAERFRVIKELQAAGSEADLLIVEPIHAEGGEQQVLKLYRRGIRPESALLARLSEAGPHVVKLLEYGISDGLTWERMEYCRAGSLRGLLQKGILPLDLLRQMTVELVAALTEIHAQRILHRDLKPENVLVRQQQPLSLALTDFGIASVAEGTRHFTDNARTVKYASPEALTGVIDAKTDWWSVGMILFEAASGRHPFAGLSEHVINHHLATRPVEIKGVADGDFAMLCRGLLLRDPAHRWGAAEVQRWLQGDESLPVPHETGVSAASVRPYRIGAREAKTTEELVVALVENWPEAVKDLKRGLLLAWLKQDLHDFDLTRQLASIMESRDETDDRRLLRFLQAAAPKLPPMWQGQLAHKTALASQAKHALKEGAAGENARRYLDSLFESEALSLFRAPEQQELLALDKNWRQGLVQVCRIWEAARKEYLRWSTRPRPGAQGRVVNFDQAVYGQNAIPAFPLRKTWNPLLILALTQPGFVLMLEQELRQTAEAVTEDAPWFKHLIDHLLHAPAGETATPHEKLTQILVAYRLQEPARQTAAAERLRRKKESEAREQIILELRATVVKALTPFTILDEGNLNQPLHLEMRSMLEEFQVLFVRITSLSYPEASFETLLSQLNGLHHTSLNLMESLDKVKTNAQGGISNILLPGKELLRESPHGLAGGILLAGFLLINLLARFFVPLMAALGLFTLWRYLKHRKSKLALNHGLKIFRRQIRRFATPQGASKPGEEEAEEDSP